MSLATTITALRTVIDTIPNLRVYADPPESINEFPSAIVYSLDGVYQLGSADHNRTYHTLIVDIYHARQMLPQAIDSAKAWPDLVYGVIRDALTAGTLDVVATGGRAEINYRTMSLPYGEIVHFGVRFTIRLKEVLNS